MTSASLVQLTSDHFDLNIYTDGSYKHGTGTAHAGVFVPHLETGYSFTFTGDQNAQFAERIGLAAGVDTTFKLYNNPTHAQLGLRNAIADVANIYTDNLANLQLFRRWMYNPQSMRYHPHRQLFKQLAATASLLPCTLRIRKVTSHTGIKYNEAADATASDPPPGSPDPLEDMGFRRGPATTFEHACTSPQGWLLRLHTARWPMPSSTSNLHGSGVPGHIESFNGTSIALTKPAHAFAITTYCHIQHLSKTPRVMQ
jgi:ribonuclease HI